MKCKTPEPFMIRLLRCWPLFLLVFGLSWFLIPAAHTAWLIWTGAPVPGVTP